MTNEEKLKQGIVIYKTEDDVVCELWGESLWGGSTKHPDTIYTMNSQIKQGLFVRSISSNSIEEDVYQWLLFIASIQIWKTTAKKIVDIATKDWYDK